MCVLSSVSNVDYYLSRQVKSTGVVLVFTRKNLNGQLFYYTVCIGKTNYSLVFTVYGNNQNCNNYSR